MNAAILRQALGQLDPEVDDHWTTNGLPRMDVLAGIVGEQVERKVLNELVPGFNRVSAKKAREESGEPTAAPPGAPPTAEERDPQFQHMLARAERRKAALEHLAAGGFTLKDLEPPGTPLQRRLSAEVRARRRQQVQN